MNHHCPPYELESLINEDCDDYLQQFELEVIHQKAHVFNEILQENIYSQQPRQDLIKTSTIFTFNVVESAPDVSLFNNHSLCEDYEAYMKVKSCKSAPSVLISPSTCCSDLPALPKNSQKWNCNTIKEKFSSNSLKTNPDLSNLDNVMLDRAREQTPVFQNLNDKVDYVLDMCFEDQYPRNNLFHDRVIKISQRNISIEDLRKPKNTKTREQKKVLMNYYVKNPFLWERPIVQHFAQALKLKESQVYKWNYDQHKRMQSKLSSQNIRMLDQKADKPSSLPLITDQVHSKSLDSHIQFIESAQYSQEQSRLQQTFHYSQ